LVVLSFLPHLLELFSLFWRRRRRKWRRRRRLREVLALYLAPRLS